MCGAPPKPKPVKEKPPQYLRNPWLDGLAIGGVGAARSGRNALRIDLGTPGGTGSAVGVPSYALAPQPSSGAFAAPAGYTIPALEGLRLASGGRAGLNYNRVAK